MDQQRSRIQQDLRGLIEGEVRCDAVTLQLYSSDASIYQVLPLGVVLPRSVEDVVATVQYALENNIPIHGRGAGSGLAGESLGHGLVIDFSKYMRRTLWKENDTVCVQPGVVHQRLNSDLRKDGRQFGPDPANSSVTTMGGVVALDSGGSHWLKYGSARRHVQRIQAVLADGTVAEFEPTPIPTAQQRRETAHGDRLGRLADLLTEHQGTIIRHQPKSLVNRCGYQLAGVLEGGQLHLPRLLAGSEGTLALFTEITVATQPLPKHRAVLLLFFDRLEQAARASLDIVPLGPSACDLIDRRHLNLARETDSRYQPIIPPAAEAVLLVEYQGDDAVEVRERLKLTAERMRRRRRLAFETRMAFDNDEVDLFWNLALKVVPTLYRLKGSTRALPFVEDIAVPPGELPGFLVTLQNVLKQHQLTASLFGHAGQGQLHIRPFIDLADPDDVAKMDRLASDLYEAVWAIGGTISGEHGDGYSRTPFVARQYGELYRVFEAVKRLFDPTNIFNPGKKVGAEHQTITQWLRPVAATPQAQEQGAQPDGELLPVIDLQLNWDANETLHAARTCNGCGICRTQASGVRMCPIFRFAPAEESSPRAKANLLRGILTGQLSEDVLASDEFKAVADLCVNCQMCRLECPANVDVPRLMIEAKAAHVRAKGLPFKDWLLTRLDLVGYFGSLFSPLANWAIGNRPARWMVEKLFGIAQGRKLPRFASKTFLKRANRRKLTRPTRRSGRKVLYFIDNFVNYHDSELGDALVAVMEHNGVAVYVHPAQLHSAMAMIAMGSLDRARKVAQHNVAILAEAVRQGYHIVATEPAAVLCLTREYPALLDDDDARLVAENTSEACVYLWKMHLAGNLQLDLRPVNLSLAYHMPCHLKAIDNSQAGLNLLRLIPGITVQHLEEGCSGMAGTFGLRKENYRSSLRAGWGLISQLRQSQFQAGTTECSACKMQMEQGSPKRTFHPLKLMALSYGLMPRLADKLTARAEEFYVS